MFIIVDIFPVWELWHDLVKAPRPRVLGYPHINIIPILFLLIRSDVFSMFVQEAFTDGFGNESRHLGRRRGSIDGSSMQE